MKIDEDENSKFGYYFSLISSGVCFMYTFYLICFAFFNTQDVDVFDNINVSDD